MKMRSQLSSVALSFPSITLDMVHNNHNICYSPAISIIFIDFSVLFPDFVLPKAIYPSMIVKILPKLEDPPIAILLAISITLHDLRTPATDPKSPVDFLYHQILQGYNYSIIPEQLKLKLCTQWNIVEKQNNVYKFSPCFAAYRFKAKDLIIKSRPNDPILTSILHNI